MKTIKTTKILTYGVIAMGLIHIIATFTPLIDGKLGTLNEGTHKVVIYFSLMCGTLLILGGIWVNMLAAKVKDQPFLRFPYQMTLCILAIDGLLATSYMPHNPSAWIVLILTLPLLIINIKRKTED